MKDITKTETGNNADKGMSDRELKELAAQLGKPEGEPGIRIGVEMNTTNNSMIRKTFEHSSLRDKDYILELGHGNANHVGELLTGAGNLRYSGLDISEVMNREAEKYSKETGLDKLADFRIYNGTDIPFPDNSFDKIFTVNTIYFWKQPVELLNELNRVLKPDGLLCITFVDKETMNRLPFTEYGFTKYNESIFKSLVEKCKLYIVKITRNSEMIKSKMLGEAERIYWVAELRKGGGLIS